MALSIQIPYKGSDYLYGGISSAGQSLAEGITQMAGQLKKAKAYRAMAVDALGMDPEKVDKMGLPELEGHFQAVAVKGAMENQRAQAEERQAKAAQELMKVDAAKALPRLMNSVMAHRAANIQTPGPSGPIMEDGGAPIPAPPPTGNSGALTTDEIMAGISEMGSTDPRASQALINHFMPQLTGAGGSTPQAWKSPEGNPYVFMHNTLTPDRAPMDMSSMMGNVPEGYTAVPTGPNRTQLIKTEKTIPPTFHASLDKVLEDIGTAQRTIQMADMTYPKAEDKKTAVARSQAMLQSAQSRGKGIINRYHATGYLTDDQRDQMYEELGLGKSTGKAPAAAAGSSQDNPVEPKTQAEFDGLKAGMWFINPKDQRVLQKK